MGWTLERQGHVRVDVLQGRWSPRRRARLDLWGSLLLLLPFSLLMVGLSLGPAVSSWRLAEASPDPGGLPRYLVEALIPLGFLLLSLQGIAEAIKARAACRGETPGPAEGTG
jgi:TRAP-type mannitol/chloroaromatic compound transport system permease small subunit